MKTSTLSRLLTVLLFLMALPALAQAEEAQVDSGDNAWILVCSALVLLMTGPGLALFYGGLVRKKNLLATMMQSFMMMAVITVLWGVVGYSLAFSPGNSFIGGFDHLFLNGVGTEANGSISHLTFMTFQLMFAIITPALISGAFRRAHEVHEHAGVHGPLVAPRVSPDGSHGLGAGRSDERL